MTSPYLSRAFHRLLVVSFLASCFFSFAFAGQESNGGIGIACFKDLSDKTKVQSVLDYNANVDEKSPGQSLQDALAGIDLNGFTLTFPDVTMRIGLTADPASTLIEPPANANFLEISEERLQTLEKYSALGAELKRISDHEIPYASWIKSEGTVPGAADTALREGLSPNCLPLPIAYQERLGSGSTVRVDTRLVAKLTALENAALVTHELLQFVNARAPLAPRQNAQAVRFINRLIFGKNLQTTQKSVELAWNLKTFGFGIFPAYYDGLLVNQKVRWIWNPELATVRPTVSQDGLVKSQTLKSEDLTDQEWVHSLPGVTEVSVYDSGFIKSVVFGTDKPVAFQYRNLEIDINTYSPKSYTACFYEKGGLMDLDKSDSAETPNGKAWLNYKTLKFDINSGVGVGIDQSGIPTYGIIPTGMPGEFQSAFNGAHIAGPVILSEGVVKSFTAPCEGVWKDPKSGKSYSLVANTNYVINSDGVPEYLKRPSALAVFFGGNQEPVYELAPEISK